MKNTYYFIALFMVAFSIASSAGQQRQQHSHIPAHSSRSSDQCWSEMQSGIVKMHEAMNTVAHTNDCDENFVRLMLPHHQAAVEMARTLLNYGKDPAMRRLAQEIITDQQSEIELMQLWLQKRKTSSIKPGGAVRK